jgi:hypothetical protein
LKTKIALCAGLLAFGLSASERVLAQPVPLYYPGAVYPGYAPGLPPHEIITIVRSTGLEPLSGPMRRGPIYAVRAVDRAGQQVRVIVDARLGRVVRIVPLPGARFAAQVVVPPPYGRPPAGVAVVPDGYGPNSRIAALPPGADGLPAPGPGPAGVPSAPGRAPAVGAAPGYPAAVGAAPRPAAQAGPPLPRPRPKLAATATDSSASTSVTGAAPQAAGPSAQQEAGKETTGAITPQASPTPPPAEFHE